MDMDRAIFKPALTGPTGRVNAAARDDTQPGCRRIPLGASLRGWRPGLGLMFALALMLMGGCAGLPPLTTRPQVEAIPASTTSTLGRIAAESSPDESLSGFRLLPIGAFAIDTRLTLIKRAERSIDVQYYQIADDETGRFLLRALRDAALRGVRVRLLMDDLYTAGSDPLLLGLAAHPNVEIRLFNPFPGWREHLLTRFLYSAQDFKRVNRRMHNKLLLVDGAMAVAGGRNIANEYLNSPIVFGLHSIVPPADDASILRARFDSATGPLATPPPEAPPNTDVLGYGPLADELDAGRLGLIWASATAYADPPNRLKGMGASYALVPLEDVECATTCWT